MTPDEAARQKEYRRVVARERRQDRAIAEQERKWNAEIAALMKTGISFDDAWIAAGGMILDTNLSPSRNAPFPPRKETETERLDREERERAEARRDPRQKSLLP